MNVNRERCLRIFNFFERERDDTGDLRLITFHVRLNFVQISA
jgi:hypothetical protein